MGQMIDVNEVINRIKVLDYFTVTRDVDSFPLNGVIPFTIKHVAGGPLSAKVLAVSQEEAEHLVDEWLNA